MLISKQQVTMKVHCTGYKEASRKVVCGIMVLKDSNDGI